MNINEWFNTAFDKLNQWVHDLVVMLPNILAAVLILAVFFFVGRMLRKIITKLLGKVSHHLAVNRLIAQVAFIIIFFIGFFFSLEILQLDKAVTSLLAGAGIIGLALGFAFQDMAANFMAGIAISLRQPFRINDIIESNDYFGKVDKINLRTTDILTPQGQLVLIPNKEVFQNPLVNYSHSGRRRIDLKVGVSYGDDLEKVKKVAVDAVQEITNRIKEKEVELFYEEFGDSSINFVIRIWTNYKAQAEFKQSVSESIMKIKKAFDENDITIPFPIRTLDFGIKGGEKISDMHTIPISISDKSNGNQKH